MNRCVLLRRTTLVLRGRAVRRILCLIVRYGTVVGMGRVAFFADNTGLFIFHRQDCQEVEIIHAVLHKGSDQPGCGFSRVKRVKEGFARCRLCWHSWSRIGGFMLCLSTGRLKTLSCWRPDVGGLVNGLPLLEKACKPVGVAECGRRKALGEGFVQLARSPCLQSLLMS